MILEPGIVKGQNTEEQITIDGSAPVTAQNIATLLPHPAAIITGITILAVTGTWTYQAGFDNAGSYAVDTVPRNELDIYPNDSSSPRQGWFFSTGGSGGWSLKVLVQFRR